MGLLDRDGPEPLHKQLARILRDRCKDGTYAPSRKIPSITRLMQEFEVADGTVRKAIALLVDEGILMTTPGLGTFVC